MNRHGKKAALFAAILMLALLLSMQAYAGPLCGDGEHEFTVELVQAATGETDGLRRYTCDICGFSYDEAIPATGHHWSEWITDAEPGCTESGHMHSVCEGCGEEKSESLPALGHDYVRKETRPTCTENGIITYTCTRCGESYTEAGAAATGHSYQPGNAQNAEAGKAGWQEYTCAVCGDSYRDIIEALPEEIAPSTELDSSPSVEPQVREIEPVPGLVVGETASESQIGGGINAMDVVFACGIAGTAACFSLLSAPYIQVLSWGKKKKREIDSRRRER